MNGRSIPGAAPSETPDVKIVALVASAGGLAALSQVLSDLPRDFPVPIAVVQHLDRRHPSLMADILGRRTSLPVKEVKEGEKLLAGSVYIAPPNKHMLVNPDLTCTLTQTELVHFVRPSADLLLESVAASFKAGAVAVVLSGSGSDASMGVQAIKKLGGTAIAQDERTSEFFGMPGAAIETGCVDLIVPLKEIAGTIVRLVMKGHRAAGSK